MVAFLKRIPILSAKEASRVSSANFLSHCPLERPLPPSPDTPRREHPGNYSGGVQ